MKNNLSYYSHYVTSHTHWKFKMLRKAFGWEGEGRFWALNNMIAAADESRLDLTTHTRVMATAAELDLTQEELKRFLDYLAEICELIIIKEGVVYTEKTQETLEKVDVNRRYKREWAKKKSNIETDNSNIENEKSIIKNRNSNIENEQIKENKRKKIKNSVIGEEASSAPHTQESLVSKQEELSKRQNEFYESLVPYVKTYGKEMIRAFYNHWSEPNKSRTKMAYELKATWDLSRRLETWGRNEIRFNRGKQQENEQKSQTNIPAAATALSKFD